MVVYIGNVISNDFTSNLAIATMREALLKVIILEIFFTIYS